MQCWRSPCRRLCNQKLWNMQRQKLRHARIFLSSDARQILQKLMTQTQKRLPRSSDFKVRAILNRGLWFGMMGVTREVCELLKLPHESWHFLHASSDVSQELQKDAALLRSVLPSLTDFQKMPEASSQQCSSDTGAENNAGLFAAWLGSFLSASTTPPFLGASPWV